MSSVAVVPTVNPAFASGSPADLRARVESSLGEHLSATLLLRERAVPATASVGIASLDALTGGLPRGALSELAGAASSGRTGVMLSALAEATRRQEVCVLVDASDSFDPVSAAAAGVKLDRLLWVRCGQVRKQTLHKPQSVRRSAIAFSNVLEQVLKVTDLLLQSGGFGMVVLDLGDIPVESVRRIPLTSWFRFRRAVEPTVTVLLLIEREACAKTCASLVLQLEPVALLTAAACKNSVVERNGVHERKSPAVPHIVPSTQLRFVHSAPSKPTPTLFIPSNHEVSHADFLQGIEVRAEVLRSWQQRKPPQSARAQFDLRAAL
jgi:hypothetical protein